jgi:hypothetical protein
MRASIAPIAMTIGSAAFQLTLQAGKLNRFTWAAPYLWIVCVLLWVAWVCSHPTAREFVGHMRRFRRTSDPGTPSNGEKELRVSEAAREEAEFAHMVGRMPADEKVRRLDTDAQFKARVDALPHNKYRILPQYPSEPFRYVETLEKRTFDAAKEVCALLKAHGPEPTLEEGKKYCREHNKDILDWHWERIKPWRERIAGGWRAKVEPNVRQVKDVLAEQGLTDSELDAAMGSGIFTEETYRTVARRLRFLAAHLEC